MRTFCLISIFMFFVSGVGHSEGSSIQLLFVGDLGENKIEIPTRDWWGIWGESPAVLRKTKVELKKDSSGERTAQLLNCEKQTPSDCDSKTPGFLISGAPWLQQRTLVEGKINRIDKYKTILQFGTSTSTLQMSLINGEYQLELNTGQNRQIIFSNNYSKEEYEGGVCFWDVMWAGDLDGDNKVDVLIATARDQVGDFEWIVNRLYLSSNAKNGKIVKQVAIFLENPGD